MMNNLRDMTLVGFVGENLPINSTDKIIPSDASIPRHEGFENWDSSNISVRLPSSSTTRWVVSEKNKLNVSRSSYEFLFSQPLDIRRFENLSEIEELLASDEDRIKRFLSNQRIHVDLKALLEPGNKEKDNNVKRLVLRAKETIDASVDLTWPDLQTPIITLTSIIYLLIKSKNFNELDEILACGSFEKAPIEVASTVLRVTLKLNESLPSWVLLRNKTKDRVPEEAEFYMKGLLD